MRHNLLNFVRLPIQGHQAVANSEISFTVNSEIVIIEQVISFVDAASCAVFHWDHCVLNLIVLNGFEQIVEAIAWLSSCCRSKVLLCRLLRVSTMITLESDETSLLSIETEFLVVLINFGVKIILDRGNEISWSGIDFVANR
jgi:hypothetical protein